jgi:hypothetical protein
MLRYSERSEESLFVLTEMQEGFLASLGMTTVERGRKVKNECTIHF